jgi:hypothetical protein
MRDSLVPCCIDYAFREHQCAAENDLRGAVVQDFVGYFPENKGLPALSLIMLAHCDSTTFTIVSGMGT